METKTALSGAKPHGGPALSGAKRKADSELKGGTVKKFCAQAPRYCQFAGCSAACGSLAELRAHYKTHRGSELRFGFKCNLCGVACGDDAGMAAHMPTHGVLWYQIRTLQPAASVFPDAAWQLQIPGAPNVWKTWRPIDPPLLIELPATPIEPSTLVTTSTA
ncbi:Hypothetical protein POVN_LOCUS89 [uncultured virus]|nr:Hypothetical protein POVN_LOCUS89 [uncultured virus]